MSKSAQGEIVVKGVGQVKSIALPLRRMMVILMILPLLFGNFVQKWAIPQGIDWGAGRIVNGDTDRDGNWEFVFSTYGGSYTVYFYELHLPDTWMIDSVPDLNQPLLWDIGDFDADGLYDLVMQSSWGSPSVGIAIFESPDSFSYPAQEVWRDTVGFPLVTPICVYDIDQDSLPEIVKIIGDTTDFDIYESTGNNQYTKIFRDTIPANHSPMSTIAFGDFDLDTANEFVFGYSGGEYSIWECTGDNSYQEITLQQLPTANITDCFSAPDADGDGKLEFVIKGYVVPTARVNAFIFKATGNNTYEIIKSFDLFGGSNDYYGGYSDVGDVDGDSIPEIALEACQNIYIIKAAGNDSFYVWDYIYGNNSGSSVRVYDIDNNGLAEVIISGNNQTRIYEYEVGVAESTPFEMQVKGLSVTPNPFSNSTNIYYQMTDTGRRCELRIYDIAGRLVTNLSRQISVTSNKGSVRWDGNDFSGRKLPGGVYFLKFAAGDYSTAKKLLLVR